MKITDENGVTRTMTLADVPKLRLWLGLPPSKTEGQSPVIAAVATGSAELAEILKIAAEMLRPQQALSPFASDWKFCKTTPLADRRKVIRAAEAAQDQRQRWAIRLRVVYDRLNAEPTQPGR